MIGLTGENNGVGLTCVALFTKVCSIMWWVTRANSVVHAMAWTTTLNNAIIRLLTNLTQQRLFTHSFFISHSNRKLRQIPVTTNMTCNRHCSWFSIWLYFCHYVQFLVFVQRKYQQIANDLWHSIPSSHILCSHKMYVHNFLPNDKKTTVTVNFTVLYFNELH